MTTDIPAAAEKALGEIRTHQLRLDAFAVQQAQQGDRGKYNHATGDYTRPCLPEVRATVFADPAGFLAWCDYLGTTRVRVHRGDYAVHFHLDDDQAGLCWRVSTRVLRYAGQPHLPGIKPGWKRSRAGRPGNEAWISVEELRVTLAAIEQAVAS